MESINMTYYTIQMLLRVQEKREKVKLKKKESKLKKAKKKLETFRCGIFFMKNSNLCKQNLCIGVPSL